MIRENIQLKNKALIVLSGGQDSATCLALATTLHEEIYTISFDYGQRHKIELDCASELSFMAAAKQHFEVPISSLKYLGNSNLLNNTGDVNDSHDSNKNLPSSFVPGRNYIFLGLAAAKAFQLGIKDIYTGVCETDFSGYPDCRKNTINAIELSLSLAMDFDFKIHTPLMYKTKKETVLMMQELGKLDWYKFTHTCYNGENPPCMNCPACKIRQRGFEEANIIDPLIFK